MVDQNQVLRFGLRAVGAGAQAYPTGAMADIVSRRWAGENISIEPPTAPKLRFRGQKKWATAA